MHIVVRSTISNYLYHFKTDTHTHTHAHIVPSTIYPILIFTFHLTSNSSNYSYTHLYELHLWFASPMYTPFILIICLFLWFRLNNGRYLPTNELNAAWAPINITRVMFTMRHPLNHDQFSGKLQRFCSCSNLYTH